MAVPRQVPPASGKTSRRTRRVLILKIVKSKDNLELRRSEQEQMARTRSGVVGAERHFCSRRIPACSSATEAGTPSRTTLIVHAATASARPSPQRGQRAAPALSTLRRLWPNISCRRKGRNRHRDDVGSPVGFAGKTCGAAQRRRKPLGFRFAGSQGMGFKSYDVLIDRPRPILDSLLAYATHDDNAICTDREGGGVRPCCRPNSDHAAAIRCWRRVHRLRSSVEHAVIHLVINRATAEGCEELSANLR